MKQFFTALFLLPLLAVPLRATTHTIVNVGNSFSPPTLNIQLGDTVLFSISTLHTVIEVSQSTWNANGNTALPGGFSRGAGGGIVVIGTEGIHYYVCGIHNLSGMKGTITVNPVTDVGDEVDVTPLHFSLAQNFPNPFNPSTEIAFSLGSSSFTEIAVYDGIGRRVSTLVAGTLPAGDHTVSWNGIDDSGKEAVSGPYFIRMSAGPGGSGFFAARKIMLVR